ncbi:MAG: hypothetical protein QXJ74_00670 [Nitrososphaera sp.]|uniref:hypothetical protein n=1 Tax=Nitrososphaera sp. TaxID=1971748 RepID=UPI0017F72BE0|nr:hypothetical protein [Nitrososphaera sp.]NWG37031.1 hypothetical protein [Nitrososphaera sp.]
MSRRPKPVRDHYTESLATNSQNLARQLAGASVSESETREIIDAISSLYLKETEKIAEECERDIMALEKVPSPLGLFVSCISQVAQDVRSPAAADLLQKYVAAWEDWM